MLETRRLGLQGRKRCWADTTEVPESGRISVAPLLLVAGGGMDFTCFGFSPCMPCMVPNLIFRMMSGPSSWYSSELNELRLYTGTPVQQHQFSSFEPAAHSSSR